MNDSNRSGQWGYIICTLAFRHVHVSPARVSCSAVCMCVSVCAYVRSYHLSLPVILSVSPAGVWGLDDYHCLIYVWGSSQLLLHPDFTPRDIHDAQRPLTTCIWKAYKPSSALNALHPSMRHRPCCSPSASSVTGRRSRMACISCTLER